MESQEPLEDYNKGYFFMPRELRAACAQVHKNTSQLVEFIAEQTFGWHARWVYLTYDEIRHGRKKANGERMGPGSFLTQDKTVRRAIIDALADDWPLIEVRYCSWGTAYAIHKRFWRSSKLVPKWEFYGRTSYSPQDDPLEEEQAPFKKTAQPWQGEPQEAQKAKTPVKKSATDYQIDSNQQSKRQQATNRKTDEMARESRPQEARGIPIDTSLDTSKIDTEDRYMPPQASPSAAASPIGSPPVSLSKTEQEETEDPPAPAFSRGEQAPLQAKEDSKSKAISLGRKEEPAPARTAELEAARQRQREAIDARRQAQELERKAKLEAERIARAAKEAEHRAVGKLQERYDALVLAKQKTEPGSPAWQQAHEELQDVKHQLAAYGWFL